MCHQSLENKYDENCMDSSVGSLFDLCLCLGGCFFLDRSADRLWQYKIFVFSFFAGLFPCLLFACWSFSLRFVCIFLWFNLSAILNWKEVLSIKNTSCYQTFCFLCLFVCLFNFISPIDNCFCLFQGPCTLELERGSINQKRQNAQQSERLRRAPELISQSHF